uniref:Uncharacterized protein n=1 Tax=Anguilla anguilla TaxID=7936 RepID=A0A0E9V4P6_ANGAN
MSTGSNLLIFREVAPRSWGK